MSTTHNHFVFNGGSAAGARLRQGLNQLETGRRMLVNELTTLTADLEGDGTSADHYGKVTTRYGFESNEYAMAARAELMAGVGKIDALGDAGNTTGVAAAAALEQLFTRLR